MLLIQTLNCPLKWPYMCVAVTIYFLLFLHCFYVFLIVLVNKAVLLFILPFSHVSWQQPNTHRSSSDFFYPKSLVRRTGRSPALQVGTVWGQRLRAAVRGPGFCGFPHPPPHPLRRPLLSDFLSSCRRQQLSSPCECASHPTNRCLLSEQWLN